MMLLTPASTSAGACSYGAPSTALAFLGRACRQDLRRGGAAQGLADAFILLGLPFDSAEAKQLNKEIFECIYFAGLKTSCALAVRDGKSPHKLSRMLLSGAHWGCRQHCRVS